MKKPIQKLRREIQILENNVNPMIKIRNVDVIYSNKNHYIQPGVDT